MVPDLPLFSRGGGGASRFRSGESGVPDEGAGEFALEHGARGGRDGAALQVRFEDLLPELVGTQRLQPSQSGLHAAEKRKSVKGGCFIRNTFLYARFHAFRLERWNYFFTGRNLWFWVPTTPKSLHERVKKPELLCTVGHTIRTSSGVFTALFNRSTQLLLFLRARKRVEILVRAGQWREMKEIRCQSTPGTFSVNVNRLMDLVYNAHCGPSAADVHEKTCEIRQTCERSCMSVRRVRSSGRHSQTDVSHPE